VVKEDVAPVYDGYVRVFADVSVGVVPAVAVVVEAFELA